ncbi:hypothetical protein Pla163_04020 [Planctomycetes bacterium Pla163]|uniref:Lipocalin-like domain-containing protein n=1 Tax=Rohdeia mirabilis TaxID=2528008 RepID=A0A518CVS0_9BACT|nr:hypothetical protein Pla163_04020 [Planctomycetes bacterium Pla163]
MKSALFLPLALVATLASCGSTPDAPDPLIGTWDFDGAATYAINADALLADMQVPAEQLEQVAAMMASMFEQSTGSLTIAPDGTLTGNRTMPDPFGGDPISEEMTGSWSRGENGAVGTTQSVGSDVVEQLGFVVMGDTLHMSTDTETSITAVVFNRRP